MLAHPIFSAAGLLLRHVHPASASASAWPDDEWQPQTCADGRLLARPRSPCQRPALFCFVGGGGKIPSESRHLSTRSRPAKAFEDCRLAAAHWTAGLCTRTCETGQTTLPHRDSAQGRPTHITSHFASLTAADAHIPARMPVRAIVPPLGALNWWSPAQPSLPRVRAITH